MTDQPVETPVTWVQWALSFLPSVPLPAMPSRSSRSTQFAFAAVSVLSLWYFGKLPDMPSVFADAPPVAEQPAPVAYVTASEVAPLIVEMSGMRARLEEIEARTGALEKAKAQITTGSISKPKKQ